MLYTTFKIPRHNIIWELITEHLSLDVLNSIGSALAGGTLFTMKYGEYRIAKDIDFMTPFGTADKLDKLNSSDICDLPHTFQKVKHGRYTILTEYKEEPFKIDIFEQIDMPFNTNKFNGVVATSPRFSIAYKLIANALRGHSSPSPDKYKDMIDLIMMYKHHTHIFLPAWLVNISRNTRTEKMLVNGTKHSIDQFNIKIALEYFNIPKQFHQDFEENYLKLKQEFLELFYRG